MITTTGKMRTYSTLFLLTGALLYLNCGGSNPLDLGDPSSLVGNYTLVSIMDKTGVIVAPDFTAEAGRATQVVIQGVTVTVTIAGSLLLTDTEFTLTLTVTTSAPGLPPQTENLSSTGTYTINGSTITITEDVSGDTFALTISVSGNRLTIEDNDIKLVFRKR